MPRSRLVRVVAVVSMVLGAFILSTGAQAAPPAEVQAKAPNLPEVARGVPMGGALRVFDLALDEAGTTSLDLTRFKIFEPDATIEVVGGPRMPVPDIAYFRGKSSDDPNSMVFLAADGKGKVHGAVLGSQGSWMFESRPGKSGLKSRKIHPESDFAGRKFDCGADTMDGKSLAAGIASPEAVAAAMNPELNGIPLPINVLYTAHIIIDTDYEYWQMFWNIYQPDVNKTAAAALSYIGDLIAYASVVYEREINTNFRISFARLWATNSDPYSENDDFCGCTGNGKLDEVQSVWSGNGTPRTTVHFISGKSEGCGCAYTGVLCSQGSGYGTSSSIGTGFNIDSPGFMWEGMVIAHEIGHNFNSPHTHNYCGEFGISDPIDICVDDATDGVSNCLGDNNASLPGLDSLTGGTAGGGNGTIMSYCHLRNGSYANIPHTFGLYTPYGKAPWREALKMQQHVQGSTACMTKEYVGSGLRVTKDCKPDEPMQVGSTATCTITVQNLGPDMAQGVVTVDQFVSSGTFTINPVTATKGTTAMPASTCTRTANPQNGAGTVTCDLGILDAGHIVTIKVPITASRPQNINDRVTVSSDSPDPDPSDNVATDEVNVVEFADLSVTKVCKPDGHQVAGGTATCEIVVTNNGPAAARAVRLNDTLTSAGPFPYNVTSVTTTAGACAGGGAAFSSPIDISCNLGQMWPGARVTVKVNVTSNEGIDINDVAAAASTATDPDIPTFDPDINNNTAFGGVHFVSEADLSVTKTDDADPVVAGGATFHYNISVHNDGPSKAVNVVVTDQVPAGLTILNVTSSGGTCNTGVAGQTPTVCTFDSIASGGSDTMQITVRANADTRGLVTNDVSVSSATADSDNSDNLATHNTLVNGQADLAVVKTRTSAQVVAGAQVDYQVVVTNNGPSTATGVKVVDALDSWMIFVSSNPACVENPTDTLNCAIGTLQPGQSKTLYLTVQLDPATPNGAAVNNTSTVSGNELDPVPGNNTDDAPDVVATKADLWIDKVQNDQTGNPSGTLIYLLTVYNRPGCEADDQLTCWNGAGGPSDAQNVVVTDPLPWDSKKLVVQYVSTGCVYNPAIHTVTCNAGTLAYGQSATFEIQAVAKGSLGDANNTATASSTTTDPVSVNNSDTVATTVKGGTGRTGGNSL